MSGQLELQHGQRPAHEGEGRAPTAPPRRRRRRGVVAAAVIAAVVGAWWFTLSQEITPLPDPSDVLDRASSFLRDITGVEIDEPTAYSDRSAWQAMGALTVDTLVMSVLASGLAAAGALASVAFASRVLTIGEFGPPHRRLGRLTFVVVRGTHLVARSVPEFVWALLIVFVLSPGLLAGALALALHEVGVLGRLASDVVDDVDRGPLRALRSSGAGTVRVFAYGVLPQVLPQLVTFLLYRWEVVVRATVVVGFITGAGLGHQLHQEMVGRNWPEFGQVLLTYVLLVFAAEAVAAGLRRLAR